MTEYNLVAVGMNYARVNGDGPEPEDIRLPREVGMYFLGQADPRVLDGYVFPEDCPGNSIDAAECRAAEFARPLVGHALGSNYSPQKLLRSLCEIAGVAYRD